MENIRRVSLSAYVPPITCLSFYPFQMGIFTHKRRVLSRSNLPEVRAYCFLSQRGIPACVYAGLHKAFYLLLSTHPGRVRKACEDIKCHPFHVFASTCSSVSLLPHRHPCGKERLSCRCRCPLQIWIIGAVGDRPAIFEEAHFFSFLRLISTRTSSFNFCRIHGTYTSLHQT